MLGERKAVLGYADAGVVGDLKTLSLCDLGAVTVLARDGAWAASSRSRCCLVCARALAADVGAAGMGLGDGTWGTLGVNS